MLFIVLIPDITKAEGLTAVGLLACPLSVKETNVEGGGVLRLCGKGFVAGGLQGQPL